MGENPPGGPAWADRGIDPLGLVSEANSVWSP